MATKKAMTEATRARLRELAESRKGRATLKGLNPFGWAAALDFVTDETTDASADRLPAEFRDSILPNGAINARGLGFRWNYAAWEKPESRSLVTHVRIKHATESQHADLVRSLPAVPVVDFVFAGNGVKPTAYTVYPVVPVLKLLFAIWPTPTDSPIEKVRKYLHGYTAGMIRNMNPYRNRVRNNDEFFAATITHGTGPFAELCRNGTYREACNQLVAGGLLPEIQE